MAKIVSMKTHSLVSIAIGTYNGERFLREQLDSVLSQTYKHLEIIICDDRSNDDTCNILREYACKDSRIKLFYNTENLGLVKNFDKAISLCSGEYIALCDQDDIWDPNKIAVLLDNIGDALLIHSDATLINAEGAIFSTSYTSYSQKKLYSNFKYYALGNNNVTGCTALFRSELRPYILPIPKQTTVHDWWIALIASNHGKIHYCSQPLINYRQHDSNLIGAASPEIDKIINPIESRSFAYQKLLSVLFVIQKNIELTSDNRIFLESLIKYYKDYFTQSFRIHSFLFHCRYFTYFQCNKTFSVKLLALLSSLAGESIHKKIYRIFK